MLVESSLKAQLKNIFAVRDVSLDAPEIKAPTQVGTLPAYEQGVLFVKIEKTADKVSDRIFRSRVTGKLEIFGQNSELPIGFFAKMIARPESALDCKDFFFFNLEQSEEVLNNLVKRSAEFIYFFNSQYDPDLGTITTITTEVTAT